MKINANKKSLPIFEALASDVRLKIINLLSNKTMNVKEIAEELGLSSAIITMHINKLERGGIVSSERTRSKGGVQKLCRLCIDSLEIKFPPAKENQRFFHEFTIPIGHYTNFQVTPTCGLATAEKIIGFFDDPRYFLEPERVNARILWFTSGFIEYKLPNYLLASQTADELEISLELGSEAPGYNKNWPSDISFFINDEFLGKWTSPGDFGGERGIYTPAWWNNNINQFGVLKVLRINKEGTFVDGTAISDISIDDIHIDKKFWSFRLEVSEKSEHVGGLTIYGRGFGNYDQDIIIRLFYSCI